MRLEVTRKADLATKALVALTTTQRRSKAAELAEQLDTTAGFIAQVMTPLVDRGWVRSVPGPTGGYIAAVTAADISVLDVIEAVDGPTDTGRCVMEDRPCTRGRGGDCALHHPWTRARGAMLRELASTPLSEVGTPAAGR